MVPVHRLHNRTLIHAESFEHGTSAIPDPRRTVTEEGDLLGFVDSDMAERLLEQREHRIGVAEGTVD
ncbi:MAG: hypothetical protein ACNA8W_07335, partial [Bradymonadaceae bacterium]